METRRGHGPPSTSTPSPAPPGPPAAQGWHGSSAEEILRRLGSSADGLSQREARERLQRFGDNAFEVARPLPAWRILLDQARSLVVVLLAVAALLGLLVGDRLEALAIAVVLGLSLGVGFWTEWGARRAMEGLRRLQVQQARVLRQGRTIDLDARQVVPGDLLLLSAGDAVPADARLLAANDLQLVEAPLTGEPYPRAKSVEALPGRPDLPLADRINMVYKGTLVATGTGRAAVVATGTATEIGRISELIGSVEEGESPLERRLSLLGRRLVWITLALAAAVTAAGLLRGGDLWQMVRTGIALAIAAVPEGLPVVATITLALGMRRMARHRALVRHLPAVETLGSVTVICSDKTGTLTAGEMTVTALWLPAGPEGRELKVSGGTDAREGQIRSNGEPVDPSQEPELAELLNAATLVNRARPQPGTSRSPSLAIGGDPTEGALLVMAAKGGWARETLRARYPEVAEVPFSSERSLMATFHLPASGQVVAYVKGSPQRLLELSSQVATQGTVQALGEVERRRILEANDRLARRGLRVLAFARRLLTDRESAAGESAAGESTREEALHDLTFLGLAGLLDPPAEGVADTIRRFRQAGVRTVMITGDQRTTAEAVARELGLLGDETGDREETLDGADLAGLTGTELARRLARTVAFCRVSPEHKLRIVEAFQSQGELVGMLGDGVNDAPALKKADIGVAMGRRGTDVAKETAEIVLQDDRFETIAVAVEQGRVIFDNIRKFILYLFSCNLSEVLVLFAATAGGLGLPLLPLQLLWLNLVTDVFPALALAVEPAEPDVLRRPPRKPDEAILSRPFLLEIALYGLLLAATTLGVFLWGLRTEAGASLRPVTLTFMTLALSQLFHAFNARSPRQVVLGRRLWSNPWTWGATALAVALQLVAVEVPAVARVLSTQPLAATDWLVVLGASALPLVLGQIWKAWHARLQPRYPAG